jgi:site-specific DNA recombinase
MLKLVDCILAILCIVSSLKVLGYVRCSSIEQATDGLSLEAQSSRITAWCDATEAQLAEIVVDAGVSGAKHLTDRPGGRRIDELLTSRKPSVDAVAVVRLDRLGRDAAETLLYLRRFAKGSVGLISIVDQVNLTTPQGRAMAQLGAVFAELERALIGQRTSEALQALRRDGRVYGPVPYGFEVVHGALSPVAAEQCVLNRIKRMRARGLSYQRAADLLNRDGVAAKRGGRWHSMSVRSVVRTASSLADSQAA